MKVLVFIKKIFILLLLCLFNLFADPLYLNNANPFPLFSSEGRYDKLTRISREEIKEFLLHGDEYSCCNEKSKHRMHANIMPYWQFASTGTDYLGNDTVRRINNRFQAAMPLDVMSSVSELGVTPVSVQQTNFGKDAGANLYMTDPMPLGAIPEPFNFFALFYENNPANPIEPKAYTSEELIQSKYEASVLDTQESVDKVVELQHEAAIPSDSSYFNVISKIVARYLGYNDTPYFIVYSPGTTQGQTSGGDSGLTLPNVLRYDYSNYKNNYYGMMANPQYRDPNKLFGYGYYNTTYNKIGVRGTFEWLFDEKFGLKIYTGFSNLDIADIKNLDTTSSFQGPTAAMMFARYPDQIYQLSYNQSPTAPAPYLPPNIYSLQDYRTPIMDNASDTNFNDNVSNPSELNSYLPDEFKTAYLVNIQNNLDTLGQILNQSFRPYSVQSFDDTTFELFYRKLMIYNKGIFKKTSSSDAQPLDRTPFILMPTASIHVTCPIAPRVPANIVFGKPLDNNGHWEVGGNVGIEFDFVDHVALGADIGASWYNNSDYKNVPVPTNQFNGGVYLYNANIVVIPGFSYTGSLGMQVDELFSCFDFFLEYRFVRHAEDNFVIQDINNLLPVQFMSDTHITPVSDNVGSVDTIPNGVLFLEYGQKLPYPNKDLVIVDHMRAVSSWLVNMINLTCNFKISHDISLGFVYQQPFLLRNAYNATTLGFSVEMFY